MINKKLPVAFAKKLMVFYEQSDIKGSHFKKSKTLDIFLENVFHLKPTGKRSSIITCNIKALEDFVKTHYGIPDLKAYINKSNTTRSEAAKIASNSKLSPKRVFQGIWLNAFQNIEGKINGKTISLKPPYGSVLYFTKFENLVIDNDIVIVGLENAENFKNVHLQQHLFEKDRQYLFTYRDTKQYKTLKQWLITISNPYLHFGDFDLAGIDIFQNQFYSFLKERATFFIPKNLEYFFKKSKKRDLYNKQYKKYQYLKGLTDETKQVIRLIHLYQKTIEQEFLIS